MTSPTGTKNSAATTASQVSVWAPPPSHCPQGVEDDDGRDEQADRVQPSRLPAQLGPLGDRAPGDLGVGRQLHRTDGCHGGSPFDGRASTASEAVAPQQGSVVGYRVAVPCGTSGY